MKKSCYLTFVILFCAVTLAFSMGGGAGSSGQKNFRGFEGKVTDENGKALKGVEISLIAVDAGEVEQVKGAAESDGKKNLSSLTGGNGKYRFIAVRPGFYRVRYSINGYQTLEKLMEFKRGSKDAVMNIKLQQIGMESSPSANQP
ncbi:carboxypeptidase-like regulatory domain-containing protein [bacterium]|nr:carboxypeptidase-like regulatory domain-containing protein [bacterium]MCI0605141.1 carboxypeptidase-like regulatory domain-containing protein [bacterium]